MAGKIAEEQVKVPELVKIRIPRERDKEGNVFVSVNDRTWQIKRGVTVEVPACVAEVLRQQEDMLSIIDKFEDERASK